LATVWLAAVDADDEDVDDGKSGGIDVAVGIITFEQRPWAFAFVQQESVELGELDAQ
jgi:hypothetical protein